jgi:hypothetical protein
MTTLIHYFLCLVISAQADGFRRAGIAVNRGNNEGLILTEAQIAQFEADPSMTIGVGEEVDELGQPLDETFALNKDRQTESKSDSKTDNGLDSTKLDLSQAPEALQTLVAAIHLKQCEAPLVKKPNCDEFDFELAPSAADRDAAWSWYQDNVIDSTPG